MNAREFRQARHSLGLTQAQLGAILDTNPTTIRKWEAEADRSTSRDPNPVACQVMRWMIAGFRPPEFPSDGPEENGVPRAESDTSNRRGQRR